MIVSDSTIVSPDRWWCCSSLLVPIADGTDCWYWWKWEDIRFRSCLVLPGKLVIGANVSDSNERMLVISLKWTRFSYYNSTEYINLVWVLSFELSIFEGSIFTPFGLLSLLDTSCYKNSLPLQLDLFWKPLDTVWSKLTDIFGKMIRWSSFMEPDDMRWFGSGYGQLKRRI